MSVRIFETTPNYGGDGRAGLFCSVTNTPLPMPLFADAAEAEAFLRWNASRVQYPADLRILDAVTLGRLVMAFRESDAARDAGHSC